MGTRIITDLTDEYDEMMYKFNNKSPYQKINKTLDKLEKWILYFAEKEDFDHMCKIIAIYDKLKEFKEKNYDH